MKKLIRNKHFYYMLIIDAVLVASAYIGAYLLRYEMQLPALEWERIIRILPYLLVLKISCFFLFGLYRGMWRYTSLEDLKRVVKATVVSSLILLLAVLYIYYFKGYSRAAFIIDWLLTILFIGGVRVGVRLLLTNNIASFWMLAKKGPMDKRMLIIGAGAAGEKAIREIIENPVLKLKPVGFLDDDPQKQGKAIHGVLILGAVDEIGQLREDFDEILIAIPSANGEQMRRIVKFCEEAGKRFRTMPSIGELIDGKVSVKALREVRIEDILGREEVHLEKELLRRLYNNKRILITGAGGSIGSELVRQVCQYRPGVLGLLDFSEFNLFQIDMMCRQYFPDLQIQTYLTDIRDLRAVRQTIGDFKPEVIFHAAAYKHVPLQEIHPRETVYNNVVGTRNLALTATESGVERFVLVSTDKAVRPTNVMGAAKRVAELILAALNDQAATRFVSVRFGNVIGSSGSVIPIFQQQISQGKPVTVTHPEVTRYFMSIPEAAQLILQAGAMGQGGEVFILDMGKPVKIVDMARDVIRLHGFEPDRDIPIEFIGLRPGEKLYEELITVGEGIMPTSHQKIKVIQGNHGDFQILSAEIDELIAVADTFDAEAIKRELQKIVPEFTPQKSKGGEHEGASV
ncbi:MAG: nucleoside-diphosphate sugar epimerase/dehydratase [Deltaproteobacteria bacterium]|nr:nucleoside-diphosphate sugar epimerase/dehydratase [Deltaproteobacteria bacterium]